MAGDWNNNRSRLQRLFNSRNSLPFSETCKVFFFNWVGGRNRLPPSPKCWRAGGRPRPFFFGTGAQLEDLAPESRATDFNVTLCLDGDLPATKAAFDTRNVPNCWDETNAGPCCSRSSWASVFQDLA